MAPQYAVPQVRLPFMAAPSMTGAVRRGQWAGADEMVGFCANTPPPTLAPHTAKFWVGGSRRDLFVAVVSGTPPGGKLLARANPMPTGTNAATSLDDAVEIFVDPSPRAANGEIYQAIINAKGAIWQQAYQSRGGGAPAWHGHWRITSKVAGNRWSLEIAVPWRDFGIHNIVGRTVGIQVCRDWKQIPADQDQWYYSQWSPLGGDFTNPATMPLVTWNPRAPVVQTLQLQDKPDRPAHIKISVRNPLATPLKIRASVVVVPQNSRPTTQTQTLALAPHEVKMISLRPAAMSDEPIYTHIEVGSADGKTIFYQRGFQWKINRPRQLWALNRHAARRIDTQFAYYPSYHVMRVRVSLSGLADRSKLRAVNLQVRDRQTGQIVAATTMPPHRYVTRIDQWKLPRLDGKYDLAVNLEGLHTKPQLLPFVRYHFPWEHNQLGESDLVVPPFTPIQVHDDVVSTVLRHYTMNGLGLWSQVQAKGKNLLAGAMKIVVRAGGKRFAGKGRIQFTSIRPTQVVALAHWSAGPLKGSTHSVWDYDGLMKTTLTLAPTTEKLDSVALVIPLVNKDMPLMTACTDGLRFNYAGKTPVGMGQVWNGSQAPRNSIIGSYVPYIWLGGPLRGVAVFGDNDRGWVDYQAKTPCQELVRKADGTLELRLNLVAKPTRLKALHRIVLGFQATPIKPMPKNWRLWTFGRAEPNGYNQCFLGACYYWGALTPYSDIYPRGQDFNIYRQLAAARRTGKIDSAFIKKWLAGYKYPKYQSQAYFRLQYRASVEYAFRELANRPEGVLIYTNSRGVRFDTPEGRTFLNEWDRNAFPTHQWPYGGAVAYDLDPVKSFRDYAMWYYRKMLTTFDDGIYWDDIFLQSDFNTVCTDAYRLPDGFVQPSAGLWDMRALIRRTAVLDQELGKPNTNMVHMTNTAIAPILAFARQDLDWEMHNGDADYQDRFSRSFILTESIGRQFGNVPVVLSENSGTSNPKKMAWVQRTEAGVLLTYELRIWDGYPAYWNNYQRLVNFGYGTPAVKVWNYWRPGYPMKVTGDKTSSIILSKPGQALIVVCDWGHGGDIHLKPDRAVLHLPRRLTATDMENKNTVTVTAGGTIACRLKKHDFRVLLVK